MHSAVWDINWRGPPPGIPSDLRDIDFPWHFRSDAWSFSCNFQQPVIGNRVWTRESGGSPLLGSFPFCRDLPAPQLATRAHGMSSTSRVRDGAGLGSFAVGDPSRLALPDPLRCVREIIFANISPEILVSLQELMETGSCDFLKLDEQVSRCVAPCLTALCLLFDDERLAEQPVIRYPLFSLPVVFRVRLLERLRTCIPCTDVFTLPRVQAGVTLGDGPDGIPDSGQHPLRRGGAEAGDGVNFSHAYLDFAAPYKSFVDNFDVAFPKFQELIVENFVHGPFRWADLCANVGLDASIPEPCAIGSTHSGSKNAQDFAVIRIGAVVEQGESGLKVRLVADLTVSGTNFRVVLDELTELPGILDVEAILREKFPSWLGMKMDISAAFHRLKIRPADCRRVLIALPSRDGLSTDWYFYTSMPMGARSSGHWWGRLAGILHKLTHWLHVDVAHAGFVYVDDSLWTFAAGKADVQRLPRPLTGVSAVLFRFASILLFYRVCGVPLSFPKTRIGRQLEWVGYAVDFELRTVALTARKRRKVVAQFDSLRSSTSVRVDEFESLVGSLSWASVIFPIARVYLHRFYTLLAAVLAVSSRRGRIPQGVAHLDADFRSWLRLVDLACEFPSPSPRLASEPPLLFRTDACAMGEFGFIAGWIGTLEERKAFRVRWFLFRVPFSFFQDTVGAEVDGSQFQRFISALEVLAVAVGIALFGSLLSSDTHGFSIAHLETDSMVAVGSSVRWYSPSKAMFLALTCLAESSVFHQVRPALSHVPGKLNTLADAISRAPLDIEKRSLVDRLDPRFRVAEVPKPLLQFFSKLISVSL